MDSAEVFQQSSVASSPGNDGAGFVHESSVADTKLFFWIQIRLFRSFRIQILFQIWHIFEKKKMLYKNFYLYIVFKGCWAN